MENLALHRLLRWKVIVLPNSHYLTYPFILKRLFCYCYVATWSYSDNLTVSCKLARLGGIVWPPADASFDFVSWLELGIPFGQGLMVERSSNPLKRSQVPSWYWFRASFPLILAMVYEPHLFGSNIFLTRNFLDRQANKELIRDLLPEGDFSIFVEVLRKFLGFIKLTVSKSLGNNMNVMNHVHSFISLGHVTSCQYSFYLVYRQIYCAFSPKRFG